MPSQRQIRVGDVLIGGGAPVAVQTMTKTETADLAATMAQIRRVAEVGADIVRVAVPRQQDAEALRTIVRESPIPVIADIHFNHTLALKALDVGAHCVRLNPGNIGGPEKVAEVTRRALDPARPQLTIADARPDGGWHTRRDVRAARQLAANVPAAPHRAA
ncbi:MAG: flavodoxin-dependent (E)-4-hydroxy-3-methylbut-2-enyl-diphosphate synthase [Solirubrobacteraceae bacterium]